MASKNSLHDELDVTKQRLASLQEAYNQQMMNSEASKKKYMHDAFVEAYGDVPMVYLVDIGRKDGNLIYKFGETDGFAVRMKYLISEYGEVFLVKAYPCSQPHKYEQWLKKQDFFVKHKYLGPLNNSSRKYEEVISIKPKEFATLTRFMAKHLTMFDGWTPAQKLQKLQLERLPEILKSIPAALEAISDVQCRLDMEKSLLAYMQSIGDVAAVKKDEEEEDVAKEDAQDEEGPSSAVPVLKAQDEAGPSSVVPVLKVQADAGPVLVQVAGKLNMTKDAKPKMGRPPKQRNPDVDIEKVSLDRFLRECFTTEDPEAVTHVEYVKARFKLWRMEDVKAGELKKMTDVLKVRFSVVQRYDESVDVTCSMFLRLQMKPLSIDTDKLLEGQHEDIREFFVENCEIHIMGRAKTGDVLDEFMIWKKKRDPSYKVKTMKCERDRIHQHLKAQFVHGHIAFDISPGKPHTGFRGFYLKSASEETREVGYYKSPNTQHEVFKLNETTGEVVGSVKSQYELSRLIGTTAQTVGNYLTEAFKEHKPYFPGDGFGYMRKIDYDTLQKVLEES